MQFQAVLKKITPSLLDFKAPNSMRYPSEFLVQYQQRFPGLDLFDITPFDVYQSFCRMSVSTWILDCLTSQFSKLFLKGMNWSLKTIIWQNSFHWMPSQSIIWILLNSLNHWKRLTYFLPTQVSGYEHNN